MMTDNRFDLLRLCNTYIAEKPQHSAGFCFWAAGENLPLAYETIGRFYRRYASINHLPGDRVSQKAGPVPARLKFVAWIKDQVLASLLKDMADTFLPPFH